MGTVETTLVSGNPFRELSEGEVSKFLNLKIQHLVGVGVASVAAR